jgi:hypothetical protein
MKPIRTCPQGKILESVRVPFFVGPSRKDFANRIRELERYRPSIGEITNVAFSFEAMMSRKTT